MMHIHDYDLRLFASGSLHGNDLLRVDAHLAECQACRHRGLSANVHEPPFEEVDLLVGQAETSGSSLEEFDQLLRETETLLNFGSATQSRRAKTLRGRVLIARSFASKAAGESNRAIRLARAAAEFFKIEGDDFQRGRACIALSYALRESGDHLSAADAAVEATRIFERLGDTSRLQIARSAKASAYADSGRLRDAQLIFEELIAEDLPEALQASVHHNLAAVKLRTGDLEGIDALLDRAEAKPGDRQSADFLILVRWARAGVAIRRGYLQDALSQLRTLHAEAIRNGFHGVEAGLRCELADVLTALERHEEALPHAVAALDYFAREGVAAEFRRAIALSVVREEQMRRASDVYRDLVRIRRAAKLSRGAADETEEPVGE